MRFLKLFFALCLLFFFFAPRASADENFDISSKTTYTILSDMTVVNQTVSIRNKKEFIFTPSYSILYGFEDIQDIQVFNSYGIIPFTYEEKNGSVNLKINFQNPPKGIGITNTFNVRFKTDKILKKRGDVYEVIIPGISDPNNFIEYSTEVIVPSGFPLPTIIKPRQKTSRDLIFNKEESKSGIVIIFGEAQYYALALRYNISNPNLFPITTEIALPPNTNYQNSLIESLSEVPENTKIDVDGNWIASYNLLPGEKKTINAKVLMEVRVRPRQQEITEKERELYTQSDEYWDTNDRKVRELAQRLKTPEEIYKYVVETLSYDYDKVAEGGIRLGGARALSQKDFAVCLEFSDLFVTLARAAGIPARSVEGYAYTENSRLRPLSLLEDVLHAWAEYYDKEKKAWIMVDPTWGNTTKGGDYFHSLDLDHIAFVVKGQESTYPIPAGGYKFEEYTKDISVEFISRDRFNQKERVDLTHSFPRRSFAGLPISGQVTVRNTGNTLIQNKKIVIIDRTTGKEKEYIVKSLPPFGSESFQVFFNTSFLTNETHEITIRLDEKEETARIAVSFIPNNDIFLIGGGIFVATAATTWVTFKTWRVYLQRRKGKNSIHRKGKGSKKKS